ncbi:unnamed protein product [Ectocarpus sp. CCAP 1310/34]|nr:unnamed protein product [Ectocarpus sp. CCAP 1310/34]
MWNTWKEARAGAGLGPWLRECDGVESALQKSGRTTRGSCTRIFVLTRGNLGFFCGPVRVAWADRRQASRVEVTFRASKADQKRLGATVTRSGEALNVLLDILDLHPELGSHAPLTQSWAQDRWKVISRAEASRHLRLLVSAAGRDPQKYALHSGRIGGATHLASMGASVIQIQRAGRWKSSAFMVYVRAGGEGAKFVSQALTEPVE